MPPASTAQPPDPPDVAAAPWPTRTSLWVRGEAIQGLETIRQWAQDHWALQYDRPELLQFVVQVSIQLVKGGRVARPGLHFVLRHSARSLDDHRVLALSPTARSQGSQIWVAGRTGEGLQWLYQWMQQQGWPTGPRSAALEVAVDLTLQALAAGWVAPPIGPQALVEVPATDPADAAGA